MRLLGMDTSTRAGSLAAVDGGRVVGSVEIASQLDHSLRLVPAAEFLLSRLGWRATELDAIAVTLGPGSFTGLRVGIATALGLARGAGTRVVGVGTLPALARAAEAPPAGGWICACLDAGRGEVYAATFAGAPDGGDLREAPCVIPPERLCEQLAGRRVRFVGDGAERYAALLRAAFGPEALAGSGPWFLARHVAILGEERLASGEPLGPLEPLYLRASDAKPVSDTPR
jgi:tRNA threonylcarbamoyladenosine biosynthesis protein TsaB